MESDIKRSFEKLYASTKDKSGQKPDKKAQFLVFILGGVGG